MSADRIMVLVVNPYTGPALEWVEPNERDAVSLTDLQLRTGGSVECLCLWISPSNDTEATMWLNEDGRGLGLDVNPYATAIAQAMRPGGIGDPIVGQVIITGVRGEDDVAVPDEVRAKVADICLQVASDLLAKAMTLGGDQ